MISTVSHVLPYQVDTDVDERAKVWEERDDWLPLQGQADPLDQAAGCLPLHLSPGQHRTQAPKSNDQKFNSM